MIFPVHFSVLANFFYIDHVQLRKNNKHFPITLAELFSIRLEDAQHRNMTQADRGTHSEQWTLREHGWHGAGEGVGLVFFGAE